MKARTMEGRATAPQLREARRQLIHLGEVAPGLLDETVNRSWQRSQALGLTPAGRTSGLPHASAAQLARALDQHLELVAHAGPVMDHLCVQTRDTDSVVILADAQGMLLRALGDPSFVDRAQRVALRPGANWSEQWRGTNAIGTALVEAAPVVVHGQEHFLERNGFLTCTAAPIHDPAGRVLGVLDVSGGWRDYHPHTLALVRSAARMIEHRLFQTRHSGNLLLRLHAEREGLGTITEGLIALDPDGRVLGADARALAMLVLGPQDICMCTIGDLLQLDLATLHHWIRTGQGTNRSCPRPGGHTFWISVEADHAMPLVASSGAARPRESEPSVAEPADALSALDTGDPAMHAAVTRVRRVLDKPLPLLIFGESGVGKEVFARAVHASSSRRHGPLVAVNCVALPETLIEAELFGYRPGAFTGATREGAPGRIREAHGGTLLLDEIGDMPLAMQARLLRVLQDREVHPLGGGKPVAVDFKLLCATHRRLRTEVEAGRFREDLYYRLNGLTIELPSLRERQDLPLLVARLLREIAPRSNVRVSPPVAAAMAQFRWPGNLRQLHNALQASCAMLDEQEGEIDWHHLPEELATALRDGNVVRQPLGGDLRAASEMMIRQEMARCAGNHSEAARRLGIGRSTLYRKLAAMGLR